MISSARFLALALLLPLALQLGHTSTAHAAQPTGRIKLDVVGPAGVPVNVELVGQRRVLLAIPGRRSAARSVAKSARVPAGQYMLQIRAFAYAGRLYSLAGGARRITVTSHPHRAIRLRIVERRQILDPRVTGRSTTSLTLSWQGEAGPRVRVRVAPGHVALRGVRDGTPVRVTGRTARATGLTPASVYTFGVFVRSGAGWVGPLLLTSTTAARTGAHSTFVLSPDATFIQQGDDDIVTRTPSGARVVLEGGRAVPMIGAGFALPESRQFPAGFVGYVVGVGSDGRTVELARGGLSDVFEELDLDTTVGARSGASRTAGGQPSREIADEITRVEKHGCSDATGTSVGIDATLTPGGHVKVKLRKRQRLLKADIAFTMTAKAQLTGEIKREFACSHELAHKSQVFARVYGIPISAIFKLSESVSTDAAISLADGPWVSATAGARVRASARLSGTRLATDLDVDRILETDRGGSLAIAANRGLLRYEISGSVIVGPGQELDPKTAGAIAGIEAEIVPLDAAIEATYDGARTPKLCLGTSIGMKVGGSLKGEAWYHGWGPDIDAQIEALPWELKHEAMRWDVPSPCPAVGGGGGGGGGGDATVIPNPPQVRGQVYRAVALDSGGWIIAGDFDQVAGEPRVDIARLNPDGSLLRTWDAGGTNSEINALAVVGNVVYIGGIFTQVSGAARVALAAIDLNTGSLLGWNPQVTGGGVHELEATSSTLYVGGTFTAIDASARHALAAIDLASGSLTGWNPNAGGGGVYELAAANGVIYVGGTFTSINGATPRQRLAAVDPATGAATPWNPGADGQIIDIEPTASGIYIGGAFSQVGGSTRLNAAKVDAAGTLFAWNPAPAGTVWSIAAYGSSVFLGGEFQSLNAGLLRPYLARVDAASGVADLWALPGTTLDDRVVVVRRSGDVLFIGGTDQPRFASPL